MSGGHSAGVPDRHHPHRPSERQPGQPSPRRSLRALGLRFLAISAGVLGVVGAIGLLDLLWAQPDRGLAVDASGASPAGLADPTSRPITVLVVGSDADRLASATNGAAPSGPANSDSLLLVRVDPEGPPRVLALPIELAVKLPGQAKLQSLGSLYRQGGPALTAEAVAQLVGLDPGQPERYVVLPRSALRELVDGLGGLELSLDTPMRYQDKAQAYGIDLQGGLQLLKGPEVEQFVRYRDTTGGETARRGRQHQVLIALVQQLARPDQWPELPERWQRLTTQLDTNLTQGEALSLLATALERSGPLVVDQVPLEPVGTAAQPLRQLKAAAPRPLWPPQVTLNSGASSAGPGR